MKKRFPALILILVSLIIPGIRAIPDTENNKTSRFQGDKKILVAYFSCTGNTREIAVQIHKLTGGDIFEIKAVKEYPADYEAVKKAAKQELNSGAKPALKRKPAGIKPYDIIFIGYPIWWGTFPAPVRTFLSENDLSGKTVVPFNTHLGSGQGHSVNDIRKLCPGSNILGGIAIRGSSAGSADQAISRWVEKLDFTDI